MILIFDMKRMVMVSMWGWILHICVILPLLTCV